MRPHVLLVDDDVEGARPLAALLQADGFDVTFLERPAMAVARMASVRFDAVVTDLDMPSMDGFGVLDAARVAQPHAKLVLITGNPSVDRVRLNGAALVRKPIHYEALLAALPAATPPAEPAPVASPLDLGDAFIAAPVPLLLIDAEPARFTILAANDAYLAATMSPRDALVGRPMFEAFPDSPADPAPTGVRNLRASFERVIVSRATDVMPVQRYDIPRRRSLVTEFEERHWAPHNAPVVRGGAVARIVHRVDDVTARVRAGTAGE